MYWIIAIVRPQAIEAVRAELLDMGCLAMTVTECSGFGRQYGKVEVYRGAEYRVELLPKVRIEVGCTRGELNQAIEAICKGARSGHEGKIGDGKIFVFEMGESVRIRTGETGRDAL
ncbi:MAG TPA: P-II family nitrogen regulator [Planctomycetota bacterium]|nr:P-II family nitrogen regulator [Planctomycetota bacterium]